MNICKINRIDVANGPGVRVSIFVSGCRHHCPGCFNKETWDFNFGHKFTEDTVSKILELIDPEYIEGLTILGGEPMEPENQKEVLELIQRIRSEYGFMNKSIWLYTGCKWEDLVSEDSKSSYKTEYTMDILKSIDVLVDGQFIEEQKDLSLAFRGSKNQRLINSRASILEGKLIYNFRQ